MCRTRFLLIAIVALQLAVSGSAAAAQQRIVGGTTTTTAWPAQARLSTPSQACGATLLSARWVLTAGHCVSNVNNTLVSPASLSLILGRTDLTTATPADTYGVVGPIQRHPGFAVTNQGLTNDLALLHLDRTTALEPMRLIAPSETALWAPGTIATVLGWGTTCAQTCASVTQLRQAGVPTVGDATCAANYAPFPGSFSAATMFCAGNGVSDTCQGDSGGPLLVPRLDAFVLAGVTSWGQGCADANFPGVYARLGAAALNSWVRDLIPTTAITASPPSPNPGQNVSLAASGTKPASQAGNASYAWELTGDGRYDDATGTSASLPAITAGSHVVRVRASYVDGDVAYAREVVTTFGSPPPAPPPPPPPPPKPVVEEPVAPVQPPTADAAARAPGDEAQASSTVAIAKLAGFVSVPARLRLRGLVDRRFAVRVNCVAACAVDARLMLDGVSSRRTGLAIGAATIGRARDLHTLADTFTLRIELTPRAVKALRRLRRATFTLRVSARGGTRTASLQRSIVYLR
jgi:secreted trypsin-like serine protease